MMDRRQFLSLAAAAPFAAGADTPSFDNYFRTIYEGFLANARRTSPSLAVCDFEGGIKLPAMLAASGKSYVGVARMLPAIAAWHVSGRGSRASADTLTAILTNAFDPEHPDYWGAPSSTANDQRQVEASIVAWSGWLLRDTIVPQLSSGQRANLQQWLARCTQVPARRNNWAWFTAVNQAARLSLAKDWAEFQGNAKEMDADLAFLDTLAVPGDSGWYTDSATAPVFDYYNFWVFASHYLCWRKITGRPLPAFDKRLRAFLQRAPLFFGANGSHILCGRSLIYRWAVVTPLVLAYTEGLWPHAPGLLRAIVRRNLDYFWSNGAYDTAHGKLRETLTPSGSASVRESYIDNGHPYWCMQAFALFLIPRTDPFWTLPEERLPVETQDFDESISGTQMRLVGNSRSGEVRWYQGSIDPHYGDKYAKLSYSTHFPFGVAVSPNRAAADQELVFVDPSTGTMARRSKVERTLVTAFGVAIHWLAELDGLSFRVETTIGLDEGREIRRHKITAPAAAVDRGIEVREGTYALGLAKGEEPVREKRGSAVVIRSSLGSVAARMPNASVVVVEGENIAYARTAILQSRVVITKEETLLESTVFATPDRNVSVPPVF
jgi:hypothetical protein